MEWSAALSRFATFDFGDLEKAADDRARLK
jgi:hypothetical protein